MTGPDPAAYARLVRTATTAVKPAHPRIALLASADVSGSGGSAWIAAAPGRRPDTLAIRGSSTRGPSTSTARSDSPWDATSQPQFRFDRVLVTRSLARQAGAGKPIWITEFGWSSEPGSSDAVSEEVQAQYEHDGLVRATTEWGSFVRRSFVFTLTKPSSGGALQRHPPGWVRTAGLVLDPGVHCRRNLIRFRFPDGRSRPPERAGARRRGRQGRAARRERPGNSPRHRASGETRRQTTRTAAPIRMSPRVKVGLKPRQVPAEHRGLGAGNLLRAFAVRPATF